MDNSGEKVVVSITERPEWSTITNTTITQTLRNDDVRAPKESLAKILMEIVEQEGFQPMWNKIIVLACVIAVSMDPLFLYIPTINQEFKCFELDKKLRVLALVWRSIFDLIYIMDIVYNIAKAYKVEKGEEPPIWEIKKIGIQLVKDGKISWNLIFIDLSVLPVPQVIILVQLSKLSGMGSLAMRKYLNIVLFSQYVPRVLRIYLSCKELTMDSDKLSGIVWVFGAFLYFLSFQRETTCWHQACENAQNCLSSTRYCVDIEAPKYIIEILNSSFPIKPENADRFDFGIFLEALQSGVLAPNIDFAQKLFQCFWWGLRNMSSLGQNLKTSTYVWETIFAVSISLCGLLFFLYLIGNLQADLFAILNQKVRRDKEEDEIERKRQRIVDKQKWPSKTYEEVDHEKYEVQVTGKQRCRCGESVLDSSPSRKKVHKTLTTIKRVPMLESMNEQVTKVICDHLKPIIYIENSYIIREGDPLDRMLFITEGTAWEYYIYYEGGNRNSSIINDSSSINGSSRSTTRRIKKGDYFGEELVKCSLTHTTISDFPISTKNLKSHTKVEAFAPMANDLMNALRTHWWLFRRSLSPNSTNSCAERWEALALEALQTIRRRRNQLGKRPSSSHNLADQDDKWKKI